MISKCIVISSLIAASKAFVSPPSLQVRRQHQSSNNKCIIQALYATSLDKSKRSVLTPLEISRAEASASALRLNAVSTPVEETTSSASNTKSSQIVGNVVFLLPSNGADTTQTQFGTKSPVECPSVLDAATHLCKKASWFSDGTVEATIVHVPQEGQDVEDTKAMLMEADALIAFGLSSDSDLKFASDVFEARRRQGDSSIKSRQCQFAIDCSKNLPATVSSFDESNPSLLTTFPWTTDASAMRMHEQMLGLFNRWTSDDFVVALMLFFNQFSGSEIDWVKHSIDATWEKGPVQNAQEFYAMISKCGNCITDCIADENCKACLDALNAVDTRDQVMSYRTVVSYESELLRDFSLCILQQNNIFGCDATIPTEPKVEPIFTWRGEPLTFETARSILVGHLDDEAAPEGGAKKDVSWEVACGANVAYDQFPSQNQVSLIYISKRIKCGRLKCHLTKPLCLTRRSFTRA